MKGTYENEQNNHKFIKKIEFYKILHLGSNIKLYKNCTFSERNQGSYPKFNIEHSVSYKLIISLSNSYQKL